MSMDDDAGTGPTEPASAAADLRADHGVQDLMATVYAQVIQRVEFTTDELTSFGASREEVENCLRTMARRRLIDPLGEDHWRTRSPVSAMLMHAERLDQLARATRSSTAALAQLWFDAQGRAGADDHSSGVQLLPDEHAVNAAMADLFAGAEQAAYSMRTRSPRVLRMMTMGEDQAEQPVLNGEGRTLRLRVTFDARLIQGAELPPAIRARIRVGDRIRFASTAPFTATCSDTGMTVLDLPGTDGGSVGLLITQPEVSAIVRKVVDDTWAQGVRWAARGTLAKPGQAPLDDRDREILSLLLSGVTDIAIARQLSISARTVERRARRMMDLLDATTRFQAGARAVQRGWI